jgi:hypothetical protein
MLEMSFRPYDPAHPLVSPLAGRFRNRNSIQVQPMKDTINLILDTIGFLIGVGFFIGLLWL